MASHIRRRKFLATLGGAAVAWPIATRAQQAARLRRIGVLLPGAADDPEFQGIGLRGVPTTRLARADQLELLAQGVRVYQA